MPWNIPGGSGNKDPWGKGRGPQGGPPDLDEIVRKIQNKLGSLFGGGKGGKGNGGGITAAGGIGAGLVIGIVFVIWLASGFYIVQQSERGVVLRFGEQTEATRAGLRWHLPWPIERVEKVNVETVSVIEIGYRTNKRRGGTITSVPVEALMITKDENIIDIEFAVQYQIKSAGDYLFNIRDPKTNIQQATESAIREVAGKNTMDFILTEGRDEVGQRTHILLQGILDSYQAGIHIVQLEMQGAYPPEQVKAAFDDANKAREDEERIKNEAEAYANDILPRARGRAARLIQEARGYKASVVAHSQGDAHRFSAVAREYAKAPRVTRDRLYIETLEAVMSSTTKVIVDQKGGNNLIYLPLDKLMRRAADEVEAHPETPSQADPVPQSGIRDRLRERVPARRAP
ncbi:MAG: FtsH protease activity modulator HflK [Acidiferrobacterales bacterium]